MAKWKVTLYLTDQCGEHATKEECNTPPEWWEGDPEDYDGMAEGWCSSPVPEGELETKKDAEGWMKVLLTYGDKHQDAHFQIGTLDRIE